MVKKIQGKTTLKFESKNSLKKKHKINKWTESEQKQLLQLVKEKGENWKGIAECIIKKTAKQCITSKKGNWSKQEDKILKDWVSKYGAQQWTECSELIQGRSGKQCRERWINTLNPNIKKGNWSSQEQELIYQMLLEHRSSWSVIAQKINGRTENAVKNYFYSSVRRLKQNPIFHLIEDIYKNEKIKLNEIDFQNQFITEESKKLNCLSSKISDMLFNPLNHKEQDLLFFLKVIFGDDFEFDMNKLQEQQQQINQTQQQEQQPQRNNTYLNISFQYRGSSQQQSSTKINKQDKECVMEVLKRYAQISNHKNLYKFLNCLDTENMHIFKDDNGHLQIILQQLNFRKQFKRKLN